MKRVVVDLAMFGRYYPPTGLRNEADVRAAYAQRELDFDRVASESRALTARYYALDSSEQRIAQADGGSTDRRDRVSNHRDVAGVELVEQRVENGTIASPTRRPFLAQLGDAGGA